MSKKILKIIVIIMASLLVVSAVVGVGVLLRRAGEDEKPAEECKHENLVETPGLAPTCTEPGFTGEGFCAQCGSVVFVSNPLSALGHTDANLDGHCDDCSYVLSEGRALLHKISTSENVVETDFEEGAAYNVGTVIRIYRPKEKGEYGYNSVVFANTPNQKPLRFVAFYDDVDYVGRPPVVCYGFVAKSGDLYWKTYEDYIDIYVGASSYTYRQGTRVSVYKIYDTFALQTGDCDDAAFNPVKVLTLAE